MKYWTRVLTAALALAAVLLAVGCGNDSSSTKASGNPTDRAFVAEMVPHHRLAVDMAAVAENEATSSFVKTLAANVARTQTAEIRFMERIDGQLAKAGVKKGSLGMDSHMMGTDTSADMLKGAKPFDTKFIQMMVPHHEGAIAMARVELSRGANSDLKTLARYIISAQEREVKQMRAHLKGSGDMDKTKTDHHAG
jgi:uncharacterized protein (DUF305 family)